MDAYAVVETGGKQYLVRPGDSLKVERVPIDVGGQVQLDRVLAISDGSGLQVGTPRIEGSPVIAEVVRHLRGPKTIAFKIRRRKNYIRKVGHRQEMTELRIQNVAGTAAPARAPKPAAEPVAEA